MVINSKLATYDKGGFSSSEDLHFGPSDWNGAKLVSFKRGPGGIQIIYGVLAQGDQIDVISKDPPLVGQQRHYRAGKRASDE